MRLKLREECSARSPCEQVEGRRKFEFRQPGFGGLTTAWLSWCTVLGGHPDTQVTRRAAL